MENTVIVFTRKSVSDIFSAGGTGDWVADRARLEKCAYVVCTRNMEGSVGGGVTHGAAFLIGRVLSTEPHGGGRILIRFGEYAQINQRDCWKGNRNPVAYGDVTELLPDIDPGALNWKPFPLELVETPKVQPLTLAEAKAGLAAFLGVSPEAIEITVHA